MATGRKIYCWTLTVLMIAVQTVCVVAVSAQEASLRKNTQVESVDLQAERIEYEVSDSLQQDAIGRTNEQQLKQLEASADTAVLSLKADSASVLPRKKIFVPNSNKAVWLAAVFPGAGQIYNRKYWKLPIIYGGFAGCAYALNWNNQMYSDYSQAYLDIMDNNPNTNSFVDFLPSGTDVNGRLDFYKKQFKRKKDFYRRNRDLSIFCFIGVYLLSIIDAYVDAELSDFDISKDLGLKIEPSVINDRKWGNSIGLQCSFNF